VTRGHTFFKKNILRFFFFKIKNKKKIVGVALHHKVAAYGGGSVTTKVKPNFFSSRFAVGGGRTTPVAHG
jgi:hypothetical protein